MPKTTLVRSF